MNKHIIMLLISKENGEILIKFNLHTTNQELDKFISQLGMERSRDGFYAVGCSEITTLSILN